MQPFLNLVRAARRIPGAGQTTANRYVSQGPKDTHSGGKRLNPDTTLASVAAATLVGLIGVANNTELLKRSPEPSKSSIMKPSTTYVPTDAGLILVKSISIETSAGNPGSSIKPAPKSPDDFFLRNNVL